MNWLLFPLAVLFGLIAARASVAEVPTAPPVQNVPLEDAFIPSTFSDVDNVEFAVAGRFNSTCWRVAGYDRRVDITPRTISLRQHAVETSAPCLRMLQPFAQIISLGVLPAGDYKVVDADSRAALGDVHVNHVHSQPESRYAAVTEVTVMAAERAVRVKGEPGDRCSELDDIAVIYDGTTILIEPRLRSVFDCHRDGITTFDKIVPLRPDLQGAYLIQVKARSGKRISRFATFD